MSDPRPSAAAHSRARRARDQAAIRSVLAALHSATNVAIVLAGIVNEARTLQLCESIGVKSGEPIGLDIHVGAGVGGLVVASGKPCGVSDYVRSAVISHEYDRHVTREGVSSMAAVPVIVDDKVRAVIYVAMRSNVRFGEKVLGEMTSAARRLEQHIAVADALEQVEKARPSAQLSRSHGGSGTPSSLTKVAGRSHGERGKGAQAGTDAALTYERMRETHAKLRVLASRTEDPLTQAELEAIATDLVAPTSGSAKAKLSRRELDVLACVAQGKTNIETGEIMGIGAETVKSYLRSAMRKLDAHTRYEAVNAARRIGAMP